MKTLQRELIPIASQPRAARAQDLVESANAPGIPKRLLGMRRKFATAILGGLSLWLGFYAVFGHDGLVAYRQKQHEARRLQQQIRSLQQENQRMALHDQRLQNDPDTIEYEAREHMHYTRPGEVIYKLPDTPDAAQSTSKPQPASR